MKSPEERSFDKVAQKVLKKAEQDKVETVWDRREAMRSCSFGEAGTCCRICTMGPCRINPKDPEGGKGICGATAEVIAMRNLARMVAAGTAAHSDHGRDIAKALRLISLGQLPGYGILDQWKLTELALELEIELNNKPTEKIAEEVSSWALSEFGNQEGELTFLKRAPKPRQEIWHKLGIAPRGIDREVVETLHRTTMGVDQDFESIWLQALRTSLADGWGGSMIATELSDVILRTPQPLRSQVNLGVLEEKLVNILIHGHEPLLSDAIARVAREEEIVKYAREKGASGVNVAGICCTGNEVLMRQGVPIAGNHLHQELAIITGAVEAMVVDVQCVMMSLAEVAKCYHTLIITTSPKAKIPGATHIEFDEHRVMEVAREIVKKAIDNFPNRDTKKVNIPEGKMDLVAGFSHETIKYMLGGFYRASYRPLNDAIIWGRIKGVVGIVGCNNCRIPQDKSIVSMTEELIANDILVVHTGCSAIASAKAGLLIPEAAEKAGKGLREICEAVGIPPVLHMGSCVDNSRILVAGCEMVREGGIGKDISELPIAGVAAEWMSEKAEAIGHYFVASGVNVFLGIPHPISGSPKASKLVYEEAEKMLGAKFYYEEDSAILTSKIIDLINNKREFLQITKKPERVLYDMAMRRELPTE